MVRRLQTRVAAGVGSVAAALAAWIWLYVSLVGAAPCSSGEAGVRSACGPITPALGTCFVTIGIVGVLTLATMSLRLAKTAMLAERMPRLILRLGWLVVGCAMLQVVALVAMRASRG